MKNRTGHKFDLYHLEYRSYKNDLHLFAKFIYGEKVKSLTFGYPAKSKTNKISCDRCEASVKCRGCPLSALSENGEIILKPGDKIAKRIHSVPLSIFGKFIYNSLRRLI